MKERYTVKEICKVMHVTSQTVRKWIKNGLLRAEKNGSGRYEIKREAVFVFMEKCPYYDRYERVFLTRSEYEEREKKRIEHLQDTFRRIFCRSR